MDSAPATPPAFLARPAAPVPPHRVLARHLALSFAGIVLLLGAAGATAYRSSQAARASATWVAHTYAVLAQVERLLSVLRDEETGVRGFALTRDSAYLVPYIAARGELPDALARLRRLTSDNPRQQRRLDRFEPVARARDALASHAAQLVNTGRRDELSATIESGRRVMDDLRAQAAALRAEEERLLVLRQASEGQAARRMRLEVAVLALLALLFSAAAYLRLQADLRARVRAEDALRRSEARFRGVFDSAAVGVFLLDESHRILQANDAFADFVGGTAAALAGQAAEGLCLPEDAAPLRDALARLREDGQASTTVEAHLVGRDAETRIVVLTLSRLPLAGGTDATLGVAADITEERRTRALKDQLIGTVSHELRNPLGAIRGAVRLLERDLPDLAPRPRQMLEMAGRNADRLLRLVGDLLDIERVESGTAPLAMRDVAVGGAVRAALEVVREPAERAGVALAVGDAAGLDGLLVRADEDRVVQVLVNLLGNAVKFSPAGGTVRVDAGAADGAVRVSVRDEGRGIPADKLDAVFERFEQVHADDARVRGGAGLGLAICRAIVQQHGGRIWAESRPGEGSVFSFTLPAA